MVGLDKSIINVPLVLRYGSLVDLQSNPVQVISDDDIFATIDYFGDVTLVYSAGIVEFIGSVVGLGKVQCTMMLFLLNFVDNLLQGIKRLP